MLVTIMVIPDANQSAALRQFKHATGHGVGGVANAVLPCLVAQLAQPVRFGEQRRHMGLHPLRGEILVGHHQPAAGLDHGKRVEPLLPVADRQRDIQRRQACGGELDTDPAPDRQITRSAHANARSMRSRYSAA